MAETQFRGPLGNMGSLEGDQAGTVASIQPFDGPMYSYQGYTFADPRQFPLPKDGTLPGRISGFMITPDWCTVDVVPQASNATAVAPLQLVTAGTNMALSSTAVNCGGTTAAQIALGVPLIPAGTTVVTSVMALDFGFTVGTTIQNSTTVAVPDNTLFQLGAWYIIGNVGNAGGTSSLVTQVISIGTTATGVISTANLTTLGVFPTPATALFAPIGGANLFGSNLIALGSQFGPVNSSATGVSKTMQAGIMRVHNPREQSARCVNIQAATAVGGTAAVKVLGYDVWGQPMAELLTASGTTIQYGQKAFKYILAVAGVTTGAASCTIGIGDTFGFPIRVDEYQQVVVYAGNTSVVNNVGLIVATTVAATNTSGDVRGTIQISALGSGTAISNVATTNGTTRLVIYQSPAMDRLMACTPNELRPLFGNAQATT